MIKIRAKRLLSVLLLMFVSSQYVHAEIKTYQYDGKLPFVQMMLNMMVAMGILDRVPGNGYYGINRFSGSPWSSSSWRDDGYGVAGTPWGSPSWGVLPPESYSLNGWVNEPWETSSWNDQRQLAQSNNAATQNNNYDNTDRTHAVSSPPTRVDRQDNESPKQVPPQSTAQKQSSEKGSVDQKLCVTDFCGLKKPDLNGLWVSHDGEMLGIKNKSYLWSDGDSRYLTGKIKTQNEYLLTSIDGYQGLMRFKYKLSGDRLLTMQEDGRVREFVRMSANQYQNYNRDYYQDYPGNYY